MKRLELFLTDTLEMGNNPKCWVRVRFGSWQKTWVLVRFVLAGCGFFPISTDTVG